MQLQSTRRLQDLQLSVQLKKRSGSNTAQVLEAAKTRGILPREAALELAIKRVNIAMNYRRWSIFSSAPGFV